MSTAAQLIGKLGAAGIKLWLDETGQLRFRAPKGALTEALKAELIALKPEVIRFLEQSRPADDAIPLLDRTASDDYLLSFSQQRFWFLDRLSPGNPSLHIPAAIRVSGHLDIPCLQQALTLLTERQQSLRTVFIDNDESEPRQKLLDSAEWSLQEDYDLSHLSADQQQRQISEIMASESLRPFTLNAADNKAETGLLRLRIARLSEDDQPAEHILFLTLHHIIADGWSIQLLIHELAEYYQAVHQQRAVNLAPLALQYIDYAAWQRTSLNSERFTRQLDYWTQQLADVPALELPLDYPRPAQAGHHGAGVRHNIESIDADALNRMAGKLNCSVFSIFLSAFKLLLHRYTGQQDICVGTPVAGRDQEALENIIGCFINLLAIRSTLDSDQTFADLVQQVQSTVLSAQENQHVPFELVAEQFSEQRSLSHTPVFQVLFTHQTDVLARLDIDDMAFEILPQDSLTAKYDMQLHIEQTANTLLVHIEYNSDLFKADTMTGFARHFCTLLQSIVQTPEKPLQQLEIFPEADKALLTRPTRITPPSVSLQQLLEQGLQHGESTAVRQGERSISHLELHRQADTLAALLQAQQVQAGDRVGICLYPGIEQMVALLAVVKSGACYVPMDANYPDQRLLHMIVQADMRVIISLDELQQRLGKDKNLLAIDKLDLEQTLAPEPVNIDHDSLLYLIYTSGSTGLPKGAGVSHGNEINLLQWYVDHYNISGQDRFLVFSAFGFDLTQKNLLAPLITGAEIIFADSRMYDPELLLETIARHSVSWINCAPSAFYPIIEAAERHQQLHQLASVRHLLFGGEPIVLENLKIWIESQNFNADISNMYGPTECTDISCAYTLDQPLQYISHSVPIGEVIDGVCAYVLDENLNPVPLGVAGELYIGGNSVGTGYFRQDELNKKSFIKNPWGEGLLYRTRDLVRYNTTYMPRMVLEFLSRADDQVKIRGFRVELGEVATRLKQYHGIRDALIIHDNQPEQQKLIAYYIAEQDQIIEAQQLREHLKSLLPDYMIPAAFVAIETWPLSANGKIDKKHLPPPSEKDMVHTIFMPPVTLLQQELCDIWQEILGAGQPGIYDNFFELGGHSLTATRLVAAIARNFSIDLPLPHFFAHPTIAETAAFIEQGGDLQTLVEQQPIQPADRSRPIPLSQAQQRLWIIEQLSPGNSAYNIPLAFSLNGELDKTALLEAIHTIIARHESLHTVIRHDASGMACQTILDPDSITVEQHDLSDSSDAMQQAQTMFEQLANSPFDLQQGVLFNIHLVRVSARCHILMACMHHIIADGWSVSILQQELSVLYHAFNQGLAPQLEELPCQYADFAVWQQHYLQGDRQQEHLQYWLEQLHNIPPCITLPTDRPRPEQQTFNGDMLSCDLPAGLADQLTQFSQRHGITRFNILLAVYALLLGKYARQDDICIGTPVSGREQANLQQLIGYFVNAVVIRADLSGNPDILTLIQRLQDTALAAFAHQDIPVESILEQLPIGRSLSYPPVAQVGFSYIGGQLAEPLTLDGLTVDMLDYQRIVAKYELTLIVIEKQGQLQINLEYNSDLFDADTIKTMAGHFQHLLHATLNTAESGIESISLLDENQLADAVGLNAQEADAILPLTAMQNDMVMSQWLQPQSLANTLGYRAELDCYIDETIWQQALQKTVDNEAVLRTVFRNNHFKYGDFAYQCVMQSMPVSLDVMDYRDQALDDHAIDRKADAFIYQPQAYQDNAFIRYGLMRIRDDKTILLLSSHHALLDGVSIVHVAQATARYYEHLHDKQYPAPEHSLYDFSRTVNHDRQHTNNNQTLDFWQPRLSQCSALDFPSLNCEKSGRQIVKTLSLSHDMTRNIKRYCRDNRMTPAHLFKLLYCILIAHYCRAEDDFYISEFSAGRNRNNADALGCYFTQIPFIFPADMIVPDTTISKLFDYLKEFRKATRCFDAISMGQTYRLAPRGRLHFMYNYYHFFPQQQEMLGNAINCIETPPFIEQTVQFVVKENEQSIDLDLYYQSDVFNDLNFLERLQSLCEQLINGEEYLAGLSLLLLDEKTQQLQQWNRPPEPVKSASLQQQFEQQVARTPDAIAICDDKQDISYQALNNRVNRLAHYLHHQGVGADICVGVCMERGIDAMVAILAIIKAGGAYVPIDAAYPKQRIHYMLDQAHIHILISQSCYSTLFEHFDGLVIPLDDKDNPHCQALSEQPDRNPLPANTADDLLYVIFTSGSTGQPKGAAVTHYGELNLLQWYRREFDFSETSSTLIISALGFDLTQKNLFAPLISGGCLVMPAMAHYDSGKICQLIKTHSISHINCAPSAFYPLLEDHHDHEALASLRHVIFGGEPIHTDKLSNWLFSEQCQATLTNNYGPTECTDIALFYHVEPADKKLPGAVPAGRPNDNINVFICSPLQQLLPTGLCGEICISGNGVGRGYINNDTLNETRFVDNPYGSGRLYRSGDLGRFLNDGNIVFVGRDDDQIKLNGLRIEPGEIEQALSSLPDVNEALVSVDNNRLIAHVLTQNPADAGQYTQQLENRLPGYMIPTAFVTLKRWPLTANGKIDRKALPTPDTATVQTPYVAPRDETEQFICDTVKNILGVAQVGIHDNFFDLGGHSLAASRAIVQIREHFSMDIPLNVLFEMTTAEKLAAYIKAAQWAGSSADAQKEDDGNRDTGFI